MHASPIRGLTLIETMVAVAISAILLTAAAPYLADYTANSRLREGGHVLLSDALYAQSEALKRNGLVRLTVTANSTTVTDISGAAPVVLRTRPLPPPLIAQAATVQFTSSGMPTPFGTAASIDLSSQGITCSDQLRCPGLRIDAGGAVQLCANKLSCP